MTCESRSTRSSDTASATASPSLRSPSGAPALVRGTGPKPGGTLSEQTSATVTITEIDAKVPSVTVKTEDGRTMSFKIEDKKNLEGVKVGDKVDITYTAAVMITVK